MSGKPICIDLQGLDPFRFLLIAVSGWMNQQQLQLINYLREQTECCAHNSAKGFNDDQRRRLAARALAQIEHGRCKLVSRKGNEFKSFRTLSESLATELKRSVVLDGEIVCLDGHGKSLFYDLLFRRGQPRFVAFDLLQSDGQDLTYSPLVERKQRLRAILPKNSQRVLFCDHIEAAGEESGARGFVLKSDAARDLVPAVDALDLKNAENHAPHPARPTRFGKICAARLKTRNQPKGGDGARLRWVRGSL